MMRFIIILFVLFGYSFSLRGQSETGDEWDELLNNPTIKVDNPAIRNLTNITRQQNINELNLYQEQSGLSFNNIFVSQDGIQNKGYVTQTGSALETSLEQINSNNQATLHSVGEKIKLKVTQDGDGNQIKSYIENDGGSIRSAELLQEGNYNKIDLSLKGNGFTDPSLDQRVVLTQSGNYHDLTVHQDPFSSPIEITQTSPPGVEGMKVNISTSAFYFPMK
ncbi:MAG TPA: hypothetical protein VFD91_08000 [Mariniphaga sp.]|nr:hypothetical protein [Mariniphaga sp.]